MTNTISTAQPNKFQIIFPLLPFETTTVNQKKFALNIIDGLIPSYNLSVEEVWYRGGNFKTEEGFESFGDWTTKIKLDSSFIAWKVMYDWMKNIADNKEKHGVYDQSYSTDAFLYVFDNFDNQILEIKFENVWPSVLGDVTFSYEDSDNLLTTEITFQYDRYYVIESLNCNE